MYIGETFDYKGFRVVKLDIAKAIRLKENGKSHLSDLGGFIYFQDENSRSAVQIEPC